MKPIFKIRRKSDGLYSQGGVSPTFGKIGKTWSASSLGMHLKLARTGINPMGPFKPSMEVYNDCEIVKFEMVEVEARPIL